MRLASARGPQPFPLTPTRCPLFDPEGRLVKRKESEMSCRPHGLANNVEPHRSLRVESPIGLEADRKESVRSIS